MIVFTCLGVLVTAIFAALVIYLLAACTSDAVRRQLASRRISRQVTAAARSLTDEEVASWLS